MWVTPPVIAEHYNFIVIAKTLKHIFRDTSKPGFGDDVTGPEQFRTFGHLTRSFLFNYT
jgi:hypothetical protein